MLADGKLKVKKKIPSRFFCVGGGLQRIVKVRGGSSFDKNVSSRHNMWALLGDCLAIVFWQLTSVMSGHPVSKQLA